MLKTLLNDYHLPPFPAQDIRNSCLDIIQRCEYGYVPAAPKTLHWEVLDASDQSFAGGKTVPTTVRLYGELENGRSFSFPIRECIPTGAKSVPFFVHLNFRSGIPDKYQPTEEIIDNGFAVLTVSYEEVTSDDGDFTNGIAGAFYPDGVRTEKTAPGKLALWAWAAMRVLDYAALAHSAELDLTRAAITGHSRLGKTALLTGAVDERFAFVFSNCAGCGGDALERYKCGNTPGAYRAETFADVIRNFPFWFCPGFADYAGKDIAELPFDQHFLTAAIAPRNLYLVAASEDLWADPKNQFMNGVAVSEVYEKLGKKGLLCPDRLPLIGEAFPDGNVGYFLREGLHSQTRTDWLHYMDFMKRHQ